MEISDEIAIPDSEIEWTAVRAQGSGGQNVNKVSSAIHLRFDIRRSSLPEDVKLRLLGRQDRRITGDGIIVIKAQRHRTQEKNLRDAFERLRMVVLASIYEKPSRKRTKPTRASQQRRLEKKKRRSRTKDLRKPPDY